MGIEGRVWGGENGKGVMVCFLIMGLRMNVIVMVMVIVMCILMFKHIVTPEEDASQCLPTNT